MRFVNKTIYSGTNIASGNSDQIDANQLISASFHCITAGVDAQGSFKLQASNEVPSGGKSGPYAQLVTVTQWIDVPNQSANVTAGGDALLTVAQMTYRWIRAVWTSTAVKASLIVQDLTYTAVAFGTSGNSITIRYLGDGTGGAETVSVVGNAITVHMEDGASTATQIRAAVIASVAASALVTVAVSGTGSNAQAAAAATPLAGGIGDAAAVTINMNALSM